MDEFLTAKQVAGLRSYYVRKLSASIRRFMAGREKQPIAEITPLDIQDSIASNGGQPAAMRSYLVDVKTLFAFAVSPRASQRIERSHRLSRPAVWRVCHRQPWLRFLGLLCAACTRANVDAAAGCCVATARG